MNALRMLAQHQMLEVMTLNPNPIEVTLTDGQIVSYGRNELANWRQDLRNRKSKGGSDLYMRLRNGREDHYPPGTWERVTVINDGL